MRRTVCSFPEFENAIKSKELVYLFGTGISAALTGKSFGWRKWIEDGIGGLKDETFAKEREKELEADSSVGGMVHVIGGVLAEAKRDGSFDAWMKASFESAAITNEALALSLRQLLMTQDVFATTNYDRLLEQATGLRTLSYEEPAEAFTMLDDRRSTAVLHIHGVYDSKRGVDNIVASDEQYQRILDDEGAQLVQNLLGTRTLIFVGCGSTAEDVNLSRFICFAKEKLKLDRPYYFLCREGEKLPELPENVAVIPYGDEYGDMPDFLAEIARLRLQARIEKNPMVARTVYSEKKTDAFGLAGYHYANESQKFCGRRQELAQLQNLAENDAQIRWWAVTGQAGAGKSRLAYELMHRLEREYFAFFINNNVSEAEVRGFVPFHNTFVIIDYIKGNEKRISRTLCALFAVFGATKYKLRVLLLERDDLTLCGSWYRQLEDAFAPDERAAFLRYEHNADYTTRRHRFLHLGDLDDDAVMELVASICGKKGLPPDPYRDRKLKDSYAAKFEQLRFRPLFVQMFVEAWIENGCTQVDYRSYEDLLKAVLRKEQERWLAAVGGDMACCASLIRLLRRACVSSRLDTGALPAMYAKDWEKITALNKTCTLPGVQREESLKSLVTDAEHAPGGGQAMIEPMYPDIIKEAMFLYYTDDEELPEISAELWQSCPMDYAAFLSRCLLDFPDNTRLREQVRRDSADYKNPYAMEARLSLLQNKVVHPGDSPRALQELIRQEERYWLAMPCDENCPARAREQKLQGLCYSASQYMGWSMESETFTGLKRVADFQPEDAEILLEKISFLMEQVQYCTAKAHWPSSERILQWLWPLQKRISDEETSKLVWLTLQREHAVNLMLQQKWEASDELFEKVCDLIDWANEKEVELFSYLCFSCAESAWEMLNPGKAMEYADVLQDMAADYASGKMKIAFNDKIHYYYLHSKYISMSLVY